jgi:hypothetical protein
MRISVIENIKGIILYQFIRGIQQLNSKILLIKPNIAYDNDFPFDRMKQLIGF